MEEKSQTDLFIEAALECAEEVLKMIKEATKIKGYAEWNDQEKITHLTKNAACNIFYMRFPVVSRCMICLDMYDKNAFKRFLQKYCGGCKTEGTGANAAEERLLKLQARYVQYVWEERQWAAHKTINNSERRAVYKNALDLLKSESDNFKSNYEKIEKELAEAQKTANIQRSQELLSRLTNNEQTISETSLKRLYDALKDAIDKKAAPAPASTPNGTSSAIALEDAGAALAEAPKAQEPSND